MILVSERDKVAHLLRRFGLGASEAELLYYGKNGLKGAIDLLLDFEKIPSGYEVDQMAYANREGTGVVNMRVMQATWYMRLLATQHPLQEKLTIFWHNHFATSSQKVDNSFAMSNHVDTLRENSLGNFADLLLAISKDPGMIYWLDNQENVKGKPNENFAREVMELFTLGIGHYSEQDVQEAARAFTGWSYGRALRLNPESPRRVDRFVFSVKNHDNGQKTVLGKTGSLNGDDVVKILCDHPQTATFITTKMWKFFVSPNPDPSVIERLAQVFRSSGLNIKSLVRAIMEAPEFYSDAVARKLVKNPVDFVISTVRQLGVGGAAMERINEGVANPVYNEQNGINLVLLRAMAPAFASQSCTISQGMELMTPPDVSGWGTGAYWISSATMLERSKWADRLFLGGTTPAQAGGGGVGQARNPSVNYNAWNLLYDSSEPGAAVGKLLSVFDVTLPSEKIRVLIDAATKVCDGRVSQANANVVARTVCKLAFGTPEFQFA